jgi:hypothetical protein
MADEAFVAEIAEVLVDGWSDSAIFEEIDRPEDFVAELRLNATDETDTGVWFTLAEVNGTAERGHEVLEPAGPARPQRRVLDRRLPPQPLGIKVASTYEPV